MILRTFGSTFFYNLLGTISKRLVRDYQLKHLASGDLLRNEIKLKTEVGKEAEEYITKGQLVPDSLIVRLISSALNAMNESWLLDGRLICLYSLR